MGIEIKREHIFVNQDFSSKEDYFKSMVTKLEKNGLVKNGYYQSIIKREEDYPTGLETGEIDIAIPHTDFQFSNTTAIFLTTLAKPIPFHRMDDPNLSVNVSVIVHLLFDSPEKQPEMLKELMSCITNQNFLKSILKAQSADEVQKELNHQQQ